MSKRTVVENIRINKNRVVDVEFRRLPHGTILCRVMGDNTLLPIYVQTTLNQNRKEVQVAMTPHFSFVGKTQAEAFAKACKVYWK